MFKRSILFANKQEEWMKFVIKHRIYKEKGDYVRNLVSRDEQKNRESLMTKAAITDGLNSGISQRNFVTIWKQAEDEFEAALPIGKLF